MGMINGQRIISQLVAGTLSGAQLQTALGTAATLASFTEAINNLDSANVLARSTTAMTALTGSALAMTAIGASSTAVQAIAAIPAAADAICSVKAALFAMGSASGALCDYFKWTKRATPVNFYALAYGNGILVGWGITSIYTSTDFGVTWTSRTNPNATSVQTNKGLTFGNGRFVAVNTPGSTTLACQSTDGITWTAMPLPISDSWVSVIESNGCFLANTSNTQAAYSLNGTSWTNLVINFATTVYPSKMDNTLVGATASVMGYATASSFGAPFAVASDVVFSTAPGFAPTLILYANGILLAVQGGVNKNFATSSDKGLTWTPGTFLSNTGTVLGSAIGVSNGNFYLARASGPMLHSADGRTWKIAPFMDSFVNTVGACSVGGLTILNNPTVGSIYVNAV